MGPGFLFELMKCPQIDLVMAAQPCEYTKTHVVYMNTFYGM